MFPASAGPVLRSHRNGSCIVRSVPFCVNRWDRPRAALHLSPRSLRVQARFCTAPKNRSVAGSGRSEHWKRSTSPPSRNARKPFLPQASLRAKRLVPRSHRNDSGRVESVPFCVNRWDRPRAAQPLAHSAKAHPCPSLPASGAPDPAEPTQNRSGAGSVRGEHRNVDILVPPAR